MRYKNFGTTGLKVSEIGAGTWGVGGRGWGGADRNTCISTLRKMVDLGVNLIDTAPAYGSGAVEEVTGEVLRGIRDQLIVSTKCGIKLDGPPGARRVATKQEVIDGCEASLKRLGTDYIDVLFVHWPDPNTPVEETMTAMNTLKGEGKIRFIGLSNFSIPLLEEARKYAVVDVIQPPFSMVDQSAKETMRWAHERNIMSMTYASLGAGILSGKIRTLTTFGEGDVRGGFYAFFKEPAFSKVMELMKVIDNISEARNVPQSQIAINWVAQKDFVLTALVGVRTEEHAKENCTAGDWSLSQDEIAILDAEVDRLFGTAA